LAEKRHEESEERRKEREERQKERENRQKERQKNRFRGATWQSNLIVGAVLCVAGLGGKLTLVGTQSSLALLGVGGGLLVWGGLQWLQRKR
jgi:hypothetical protein